MLAALRRMVLIVSFSPALSAQAPPVVLDAPSLRLTQDFSQIGAVAELRDGRLIVADSRDHQLYLVQPAQDRVDPLGTKGRGPGEYQNSWGLTRYLADTILVYDPRNSQFLRIDPQGRVAGGMPITSAARRGGLSQPRGVDGVGRIYWDRVAVDLDRAGNPKRRATVDIIRWQPGTERVDTIGQAADHAPAMHEHRFHPFAERDAWVVTPAGRVAVVVAGNYHLRWLGGPGTAPLDGPGLARQRIPVTNNDRAEFRRERAEQSAGRSSMSGPAPRGGGPPSTEAIRRQEVTYPDEMFPRDKPPFEDGGAWLSPDGTIWVALTGTGGPGGRLLDVLDPAGTLKHRIQLPPGRRVVGLERGGIYLAMQDADGLEFLERYSWPAAMRR